MNDRGATGVEVVETRGDTHEYFLTVLAGPEVTLVALMEGAEEIRLHQFGDHVEEGGFHAGTVELEYMFMSQFTDEVYLRFELVDGGRVDNVDHFHSHFIDTVFESLEDFTKASLAQ